MVCCACVSSLFARAPDVHAKGHLLCSMVFWLYVLNERSLCTRQTAGHGASTDLCAQRQVLTYTYSAAMPVVLSALQTPLSPLRAAALCTGPQQFLKRFLLPHGQSRLRAGFFAGRPFVKPGVAARPAAVCIVELSAPWQGDDTSAQALGSSMSLIFCRPAGPPTWSAPAAPVPGAAW
jgi:hypothetical protein